MHINILQLERVCCLTSRYTGGRALQAMASPPPAPSLLAPSLDLDMNIYSRHFTADHTSEMIPIPMLPPSDHTSPFPDGTSGLLLMEEDKSLALELAVSSMDELIKLCQANEPLWIRNNENERDILNFEEHARLFHWPLNLKSHSTELRREASRDTAVVIMNSVTLVDAFLDAVSDFYYVVFVSLFYMMNKVVLRALPCYKFNNSFTKKVTLMFERYSTC